jgi:hypothetical protein
MNKEEFLKIVNDIVDIRFNKLLEEKTLSGEIKMKKKFLRERGPHGHLLPKAKLPAEPAPPAESSKKLPEEPPKKEEGKKDVFEELSEFLGF